MGPIHYQDPLPNSTNDVYQISLSSFAATVQILIIFLQDNYNNLLTGLSTSSILVSQFHTPFSLHNALRVVFLNSSVIISLPCPKTPYCLLGNF